MNARGDEHRRQGVARVETDFDAPPDPFEDIAAPPLRTTPPPPRPAPRPVARPAPVEVDPDLPFELADQAPAPVPTPADPPKPATAPLARPPAAASAGRPSGLRQLRAAAVAALVVAVGIVALAVAFRPPAEPPAETPPTLGSGPVPAPAPAPAASGEVAVRPVAGERIEMRVEPGLPEARRAALEAAVTAAGYGGLEITEAAGPVDRGRIEFYHPADRAAAEALARSLAPLTGGPLGVHDMSGVTLGASPGRIAAWIAE